jgi:hypothetical protein
VSGARFIERLSQILGEKRQEGLADELSRAGGEQALCRGVGVADYEIIVEGHDCGRQQLQAREVAH